MMKVSKIVKTVAELAVWGGICFCFCAWLFQAWGNGMY